VDEPGTGEVSADPPPAASPPLFSPPPKADGDGTADPGPQPEAVEEPGTGEVSADPPPAASPPLFSPPPKPDSAEWFAERMGRLQEKVDEEERTWEPPVWVPPPIVGQMWPWGAGGADEGSPTDSARFDWDAQPTVPSEPLLVGHAETERPRDVESAQASRKARVWGVGGIAVAVVLVVILVLIF